ncbi:MAG: hypothetical protein MSA20_06500 [Bacteroidales bacterium]|nr:hypothetical protein [Bacteroidales bacterium]
MHAFLANNPLFGVFWGFLCAEWAEKKGDRRAISRYGAAVAIGVCRLPGNAGIAGEAFAI